MPEPVLRVIRRQLRRVFAGDLVKRPDADAEGGIRIDDLRGHRPVPVAIPQLGCHGLQSREVACRQHGAQTGQRTRCDSRHLREKHEDDDRDGSNGSQPRQRASHRPSAAACVCGRHHADDADDRRERGERLLLRFQRINAFPVCF